MALDDIKYTPGPCPSPGLHVCIIFYYKYLDNNYNISSSFSTKLLVLDKN